MFHITSMAPGHAVTRCITVRPRGVAATLRLYGSAYTTTRGLGSYLDLRIERSAAGTGHGCPRAASLTLLYRGTTAGFGRTRTSWASGVRAGRTGSTGTAAWSYRITATLARNTPNTAQRGTARLGFTWESQPS
jgi:hypothetical protein